MKSLHEVREKITAVNAEISSTQEEARKITAALRDYAQNVCNQSEKPDPEKAQALEVQLCKLAGRENNLRLSLPYWRQNARAALVAEHGQQILAIWNSYQGKAYGPKTRDKIRAEVKAATGCGFHVVSEEYRQEFIIHPPCPAGYGIFSGSEYDAVLCTQYTNGEQVQILTGNRVQPLSLDDFNHIPAFVGDVSAAVENAKELYGKAHEAYKAYEAARNAYRAAAAHGMPDAASAQYYETLTF